MMNDKSVEQEDKMNIGLSVTQRDLLKSGLLELTDTTPPRAVWQRIEAQARAEGLFRGRYFEMAKWLTGAAIAAAVVLAVLNFPTTPLMEDGIEVFPATPDASVVGRRRTDESECIDGAVTTDRKGSASAPWAPKPGPCQHGGDHCRTRGPHCSD